MDGSVGTVGGVTDEARFESAVDRAIREAAERGAFDDLPGKGKPLPQLQGPSNELWWVRRWMEREGVSSESLLPPAVQLRKELDRLPETLRALTTERRVRDTVEELNARVVEHIRFPSGPHVPIGRVDVEQAVRRWRDDRRADRTDPRPEPASRGGSAPGRPTTPPTDPGSGDTTDPSPGARPGRLAAPLRRWWRRRRHG